MATNILMHKSVKGMMWSYFSTFTNASCNILFAAVMARLINPEAFGLFAMAQIVLRFGQYFAQMGLGSALVQKAELSLIDIRTAWSMVLTLSCAIFGVVWIFSPLAAHYFHNNEVMPIIRIAVISLVLQTIAVIPLSLLRRDMNFRCYSLIEISSYILGYGIVGVVCAWNNMGVWSLVVAQIGQSTLQAVLSWSIARCPLLPGWNSQSAKRLLSFGGRVSIISFLEFISANIDTMLVGRFLGQSMLGYYNRGVMVPQLPLYYTSVSLNRVLFPLFSQLNCDESRQIEVFRKGFFLLSLILIPAATALSLFSPLVVQILLGSAWKFSIPIVKISSFAVLFALLSSPLAILCEARAFLNGKIVVQVIRICSMLIFFWILKDNGIIGMAHSFLISQILGFISYLVLVKDQVKIGLITTAILPGFLLAVAATIGVIIVSLIGTFSLYTTWSLQLFGFAFFISLCFFSKLLNSSRVEFFDLLINLKKISLSKR